MEIKIINSSNVDLTKVEPLLRDLLVNTKKRLNLSSLPSIKLLSDPQNSVNVLGKTAHYEPKTKEICVYTDERHPKDILRSIAHEMIHFFQDERGDLSGLNSTNPGYTQEDGHLRKMEEEAYLKGNMIFRDWEDGYKKKNSIKESTNYSKKVGSKQIMSSVQKIEVSDISKIFKTHREGSVQNLMERWGYVTKEGSTFLNESVEKLEEEKTDDELTEAIAPMNSTTYESTDERRIDGETDSDTCGCPDKPLPSTVDAKFDKLEQKKLDEVMKKVMSRIKKEVLEPSKKKV